MERSSAQALVRPQRPEWLLVGEYFFDCKLLQRTRLVKRRRQQDSGHAASEHRPEWMQIARQA